MKQPMHKWFTLKINNIVFCEFAVDSLSIAGK